VVQMTTNVRNPCGGVSVMMKAEGRSALNSEWPAGARHTGTITLVSSGANAREVALFRFRRRA
jgi:hypothetical protein